jgi:hypothetical protein
MISDHNPRSAACLAGFFAFLAGAIFPGFPVKDPIADSRSVKVHWPRCASSGRQLTFFRPRL